MITKVKCENCKFVRNEVIVMKVMDSKDGTFIDKKGFGVLRHMQLHQDHVINVNGKRYQWSDLDNEVKFVQNDGIVWE